MNRTGPKYPGLLLTLLLVLFTAGGCVYVQSPPGPAPSPTSTLTTPATPINPTWTPPPQDTSSFSLPGIADVVAAVKPSVVAINTEVVTLDFFNRPFTQQGAGSGWIIDENGIIVTNNHVIEDARTITVSLDDGRTFNADPANIFTDSLNDLAVLKINARGLPAIQIGDSTKMRIGDWVVTIGNSLGLGISAKQGIVSRLGVNIPVDQGQTLYDLIETSAAINPGNSGGPLLNMSGEVIGITSAKISRAGVEGMGYAISTETAIPILEELIQNGYVVRPWLGVSLYPVDEFTATRYRLSVDRGALITQIARDSPADSAGLETGDVILNFDGKEINDAEDIIRAIHASKIGQETDIVFQRGDQRLSAKVVPRESPPPP